jgi:hypothetical protein
LALAAPPLSESPTMTRFDLPESRLHCPPSFLKELLLSFLPPKIVSIRLSFEFYLVLGIGLKLSKAGK